MSPTRSMARIAAATSAALALNLGGCGEKPYEPQTQPPQGMTVGQWAQTSIARIEQIPEGTTSPHVLTHREATDCITASNATNAWGEALMTQTALVAGAALMNPGPGAQAAIQAHERDLSRFSKMAATLEQKCSGPM